MRKLILLKFLLFIGIATLLLQSCKDDGYLRNAVPVPNQSFVEEFDTTSAALRRGWTFVNASDPVGSDIWQQGGGIDVLYGGWSSPWFHAYSNKGTFAGFLGVTYLTTSAASGTISNYLISPVVTMQNGDKIIFYTRAVQSFDGVSDSTDFGNRLQVNINTTNTGTSVGTGIGKGDFTTTLLDINPNYFYSSYLVPKANAYPSRWTRFEATVYGLNAPTKGRFAFRYFVENGGSNGNGSGVAIDSVAYKSVGY